MRRIPKCPGTHLDEALSLICTPQIGQVQYPFRSVEDPTPLLGESTRGSGTVNETTAATVPNIHNLEQLLAPVDEPGPSTRPHGSGKGNVEKGKCVPSHNVNAEKYGHSNLPELLKTLFSPLLVGKIQCTKNFWDL